MKGVSMASEPIPIRGGVIEEINILEREIADHEDNADEARWRQAELVAIALDSGETVRGLAAKWISQRSGNPYSHVHVIHTAASWRRFGSLGYQARPPFNEAYHSDDVRRDARKDEDAETKSARDEWKSAATDTIRVLASSGEPFTSEDVTQRIGLPSGGKAMNLNNQVGALMTAAAKRGDITKTDITVPSQNPTSHGAQIAVWQGTAPAQATALPGTSDPDAWAFIRAVEALGRLGQTAAEMGELIHQDQRYRVERNLDRAIELVTELRKIWGGR